MGVKYKCFDDAITAVKHSYTIKELQAHYGTVLSVEITGIREKTTQEVAA